MARLLYIVLLCVFALGFAEEIVHFCDESCGPVVSKCLLLGACNCTIAPSSRFSSECSCCRNCTQCLGAYYAECCACMGLCETSKVGGVHNTSEVEAFEMTLDTERIFEEHFVKLTDAGWTSYSLPVREELLVKESNSYDNYVDNCTVLYMNTCMSSMECRKRCRVLCASRMRWFHSGCCECVGSDCVAYGSREPKCTLCGHDEL